MVSEIPASRLFLETDGIDAIAWAHGMNTIDLAQIPKVLKENLEYTALIKNCSSTFDKCPSPHAHSQITGENCSSASISEQMHNNLKNFLN